MMPRGSMGEARWKLRRNSVGANALASMADPKAGVKIGGSPTVERRREMHGENVPSRAFHGKVARRATRGVGS
jgi:hypothetical protein